MGIFRARPSVVLQDNTLDTTPGRNSWYGERFVLPTGEPRQVLGDEGSYYGISQPVLGTDIVGHVAPSLANNDPTPTKALLHIFNASATKYITMDFVTLRWVIVNASSTATGFLVYTDQLGVTGKTSGGTAVTPYNSKSSGPASQAAVTFGAVVTAAATTGLQRHLAKYIRPVIAVAGDEATFSFGPDRSQGASVPLNGVAVVSQMIHVPPVTIMPGGNFYLCEANPSGAATGATYHFTGGFIER